MQEERHPKSPLQQEGLFSLVKAQKLNIHISPRKLPPESRECPAEKRMGRLEDLGCQGGSGAQRRGRIKPTSEDRWGQQDTNWEDYQWKNMPWR